MRPIPKSRHAVAAAILLAVAVLAALHATLQRRPSDHQLQSAAVIVSSDDPRGFESDGLVGSPELRHRSQPAWIWLIDQIRLSQNDSSDVSAWFAALAFPLTGVFLLGMYGLLWQQNHSWKASCLGAILAMAAIEPLHSLTWGMGSLRTLSADGLVIAFTPLCVWWLWSPKKASPLMLWVFLCVGLLANFNFAAAATVGVTIATTNLLRKRSGVRDIVTTAAALLTAMAAAAPVLLKWYHYAPGDNRFGDMLTSMAVNGPVAPTGVAAMMSGLFELSVLVRLLVLAIPAAAVAVGFERFRVRKLRLWLSMILVCITAATIFIIIAVSDQQHRASWLLIAGNFIRLIPLPLYVLFTQALVHVSRGGLKKSFCWIVAAVAAFWLAPSDNLSWPRHKIEDIAASMMPAETRPHNVQNRQLRRQQLTELTAIADWLKMNSPRDKRIICEYPELRILAERPLLAADEDLPTRVLIDSDGGAAAREILNQQRELLNPTGGHIDLRKLSDFASQHKAFAVIVPAWATRDMEGPAWPQSSENAWGDKLKIFLPQNQPQ